MVSIIVCEGLGLEKASNGSRERCVAQRAPKESQVVGARFRAFYRDLCVISLMRGRMRMNKMEMQLLIF